MAQPRSQGPLSSYLEKVPGWAGHVSMYTNQIPTEGGSTKEKVALPHRRYFES